MVFDWFDELIGTKHTICYSGGHSSALTAIEVVRQFGSNDVILLNHDIHSRSEDKDIKRFKEEIADYLKLPITYANAPDWETKDQFDVVIEAQAFKVGNGTALCTNRMKTQPFEKYLAQEFPDKSAIIYYGFDKAEASRIQRRASHLALLGFRTDYPLAFWENRTIWNTTEIGIAPPLTYGTFKHANCTGCLKAGRQHWYVVFCTRPDIWERAKTAEDEIGYSIIKGVYLEELEPLFSVMRCAGIKPTEHVPFQTFWANIRKLNLKIDFDEQEESKPCECVI